MRHLRLVAVTILGLSVSACGAIDVATRNAPLEILPDIAAPQDSVARAAPTEPPEFVPAWRPNLAPERAAPVEAPAAQVIPAGLPVSPAATPAAQQPAAIAPAVSVTAVNVRVPETLRVSEANLYYPLGDIVWREDPRGNRYEQVRAIMQTGLESGVAALSGPVPVVMDVEVLRFHSLSEKARYTVGGMHSILFTLTLRHAETGAIVAPTRRIDASFKAFGGAQAIAAENRGITQKLRITERLAGLIRQEILAPGSTQVALSDGPKTPQNPRN